MAEGFWAKKEAAVAAAAASAASATAANASHLKKFMARMVARAQALGETHLEKLHILNTRFLKQTPPLSLDDYIKELSTVLDGAAISNDLKPKLAREVCFLVCLVV